MDGLVDQSTSHSSTISSSFLMADSSICTLTGNGDVFGVELRSDGRTPSLTPLPPSTHVCVPSSMKALISLTRSFGESAHLASSHGVTSNNDNKC